MTKGQGLGVEILVRIADGAMRHLPREEMRGVIDGLTDQELAAVMDAASAADVAQGGTGNLLYESAAARLRGVDVEHFGSGPKPEDNQKRSAA